MIDAISTSRLAPAITHQSNSLATSKVAGTQGALTVVPTEITYPN